jgi:hypothetical protein
MVILERDVFQVFDEKGTEERPQILRSLEEVEWPLWLASILG